VVHSPLIGPAQGYAHPSYAASLAEFGAPRLLPRSGGWVLEREIQGTNERDAMGCYPIFACQDWRGLEADLNEIDDLVCVSLVSDPFGACDEALLRRCFGERTIGFKSHFVAELNGATEAIVSRHHRYYAKKALERVSVERCREPEVFLDEWLGLYAVLTARHRLSGIKAFSRAAFAAQLRIPGVVVFRATHDGETVGAHLWYLQGEVAHSHLAAVSPLGYELMASYALYWSAMKSLAAEARWLNFGAGSGLGDGDDQGLTRFKRGWSNGTRTAYLCGRIFNHQKYQEVVEAKRPSSATLYFPAYREGEFA